MAKRGPKPKLTAAIKLRVIDLLTIGMSMQDVRDRLSLTEPTLRRARHKDSQFDAGVKSAFAAGKEHHLRRVHNGDKNWQASAWMLERKWGEQYGQKVKLDVNAVVVTRVEELIVDHAGPATHHQTNGTAAPGAGRVPGL